MDSQYHVPVMLDECIKALDLQPSGHYADATFGGGGHSKAILKQLGSTGRLMAFDQDEDVLQNIPDDERLTFVHQNFRFIARFVDYLGWDGLDGILADLGISSHQIDEKTRGFAHRLDGVLDMRMDNKSKVDAKTILNEYNFEQLAKIFRVYGELHNPGAAAKEIIRNRDAKPIETTSDLKNALAACTPKKETGKYYSQVFQAIRIEVNQELKALEELLTESTKVLKSGGRMVIMSYHSLEDRIVKNYFNTGNFDGTEIKDIYGKSNRPLKPINKKPIVPTEEEIASNPRARSAKLRIAVKL